MTDKRLSDIARAKRHLHLIEKLHAGKALSRAEIAEVEEFEANDMKKKKIADTPPEPRFLGILEVLDYLKAEGWKIEKTKLYGDKNKIAKEKDGSYTKKAVDEYARLLLQRLDGSDSDLTGFAERKALLEIDLLEEKKKEARRDNEIAAGLWVLKSEAEQKHTAKLAIFLSAVDNFIYGGKIEEAIDLVKGDRDRSREMKEFLKAGFLAGLHEYGKRPVFNVPIRSMEEAEEFKALANAEIGAHANG